MLERMTEATPSSKDFEVGEGSNRKKSFKNFKGRSSGRDFFIFLISHLRKQWRGWTRGLQAQRQEVKASME